MKTKNLKSMAIAVVCAGSLLMGSVMPVEAGPGSSDRIVAMISDAAPQYGVPAWFALRIAKVESNYNPLARGSRGELGLFQLKCATASEVGFRGNCSELLNPQINIRYGLKHLALAIKKSNGNLQMAASKHNGGLSRKTLVASYVAKVF
jgi:soluble lytic murein transglycosylase-like protein